eukprot:1137829-Pelagomonas_calceolata.AAC.2
MWVWWVRGNMRLQVTRIMKRKDYASQVKLRALRKGPLTSKLARASPSIAQNGHGAFVQIVPATSWRIVDVTLPHHTWGIVWRVNPAP